MHFHFPKCRPVPAAKGCRVVFDATWSDDLDIDALADVLSSVYLFTPNEKEALKLTGAGDAAAALLQLKKYVENPIVKLGRTARFSWRETRLYIARPLIFLQLIPQVPTTPSSAVCSTACPRAGT